VDRSRTEDQWQSGADERADHGAHAADARARARLIASQ
jgi:hypothetical protein